MISTIDLKNEAYLKGFKIINSCITLEQIDIAENYINLYEKMFKCQRNSESLFFYYLQRKKEILNKKIDA